MIAQASWPGVLEAVETVLADEKDANPDKVRIVIQKFPDPVTKHVVFNHSHHVHAGNDCRKGQTEAG